MASLPVYADPVDDIAAAIYEGDIIKGDIVKIKSSLRKCGSDSDCTAVLSLCRWRAVSKASEKYTKEVSAKWQPVCAWPPPPATPPAVRCLSSLCDIAVDGKYY